MDKKIDVSLNNYLFNNGEFPFKKRARFLVLKENISEDIYTLLGDFLKKLEIIKVKNNYVLFFEEDGLSNIDEIFQTISDDFSIALHIHEGLTITKNVPGNVIIEYVNAINENNLLSKEYSNLCDFLFSQHSNIKNNFLYTFKKYIVDPVINKSNNRDILEAYFKNDLNVLKTSKELYLNRNSLTNRLEIISRDIGLNIQHFKSASIILIIMNLIKK